jgi:hypothetical protein
MSIQRFGCLITAVGIILFWATGLQAATPVPSCGAITHSGVYQLDRDLRGSAGAACLLLQDANDVELDCGGHSIVSEDSSQIAILVQGTKNFRIRGCSLPQRSGLSLYVIDSAEGTISQNEFQDVVIQEKDAAQAASIHVIDNRFFAPDPSEIPIDFDRSTGVIPITTGVNWLFARQMAIPALQDDAVSSTAGADASVEPVVFPNPWRSDRDSGRTMTFGGLPEGCTVKIYTVTAHQVVTLSASGGAARWDLRSSGGNTVSSGVYFYVATTVTGVTAKGKLAVIR